MQRITFVYVLISLSFSSVILSNKFEESTFTSNAPQSDGTGTALNVLENTTGKQEQDHNYPTILDVEWGVSRQKNEKTELPLTLLNIYESFGKNRRINDYDTTTVRCHFNKANTSNLGLYKFDFNHYTDKNVDKAELHLYVSYDDLENNSYLSYDYLVIRMYQVLPTNLTDYESSSNPDLHKLLSVAYMPSFRQGWQVFKVKMAVESWLNGEPNLGLLIAVSNKREERIHPSFVSLNAKGIFRPFLIVQTNGKATTNEGFSEHKSTKTEPNSSTDIFSRCDKREWTLNFKDLGWDDFIIEPKLLKAGRCYGNCASVTKGDTTLYTYLFHNHFKRKGDNEKHELCCVPSNFLGVPFMFYNNVNDVVIKVYNDLIVDHCECR